MTKRLLVLWLLISIAVLSTDGSSQRGIRKRSRNLILRLLDVIFKAGNYHNQKQPPPVRRLIRPYDARFNERDRPRGPPYVRDRPGPLSFNLGRWRFRQNVYDFRKNQRPFVFKPGPLSFRIGPFKFNQIPTQQFTFDPCCTDPAANCELFVDCSL